MRARFVPACDLPACVPAWRKLMAQALDPHPFLEPGFALACLNHLPQPAVCGAFVVEDGETMLALVPAGWGSLRQRLSLAGGMSWGTAFAPLSLPLVSRHGAEAALAAFLGHLQHEKPALWVLPLVDTQTQTMQVLRRTAITRGHGLVETGGHERAALRGDTPWCGLSGKKRKDLRRLAARLAEKGALRFTTTATELPPEEAFEAYLQLEKASWKGVRGTALQQQPAQLAFYRAMLAALHQEGKAEIAVMSVADRPVASSIMLHSGGRAAYHKTAYDPAFAAFSPGLLLSQWLSQRLDDEKRFAVVDSCAIAGHPMIDRLWQGRIAMADWLLSATARPGLAFHAAVAAHKAQNGARHGLKQALARLRG